MRYMGISHNEGYLLGSPQNKDSIMAFEGLFAWKRAYNIGWCKLTSIIRSVVYRSRVKYVLPSWTLG